MDRGKPGIKFPCRWSYKVVGRDPESVRAAVQTCLPLCLPGPLQMRAPQLLPSPSGAGAGYFSLTLTLIVNDENERRSVFSALAENPEIIMVI